MNEYTKGKLEISPKPEKNGFDIFCRGMWVTGIACGGQYSMAEAKANAKRLVKCWNAFEPDGSVDKLVAALNNANDRGYFDPHPDDSEEEAQEKLSAKAALAAADKE